MVRIALKGNCNASEDVSCVEKMCFGTGILDSFDLRGREHDY